METFQVENSSILNNARMNHHMQFHSEAVNSMNRTGQSFSPSKLQEANIKAALINTRNQTKQL